MKTDIWMPLYIRDYLIDTGHLTNEQHGIYLKLIMNYWVRGFLPNDIEMLCRLIGVLKSEAKILEEIIDEFFYISENRENIYHKRIDIELKRANEIKQNLSERGKLGARNRWAGNASANATANGTSNALAIATGNATANAQAMPKTMPKNAPSPSPSPSPIQLQTPTQEKVRAVAFAPPTLGDVLAYCMERSNSVDPHRFLNFYQSKNWMIGKNKMADWKAAVRTWENKDKNSLSPRAQQSMQVLENVRKIQEGRKTNE